MIRIKNPFSMIVCGPSSCGKTTFIVKLIKNASTMCDQPYEKIYWSYSEDNAKPSDMENVEFIKGVPETIENNTSDKYVLLILDDLMNESDSEKISNLFTRGSHHNRISTILVTQNCFAKGRFNRNISLNAKYMVIFKNPRDSLQFQYLARQIAPDSSKELFSLYKEVTERPHTYLFIDLNQNTPDLLRFRTDIFETDYSTLICRPPCGKLNDEKIQLEKIGETEAYAVCFTEEQM